MRLTRLVVAAVAALLIVAAVPALAGETLKVGPVYQCYAFTYKVTPKAALKFTANHGYAVGKWHTGSKLTGVVKRGTYSVSGSRLTFRTGPYKPYWAVIKRSQGYMKGAQDLAFQEKRPGSPPKYAYAGEDCLLKQ